MRGKALLFQYHSFPPGITPAYAGKRPFLGQEQRTLKDHPRLCGEKYTVDIKRGRMTGSPPPMRGKEKSVEVIRYAKRITPAYAGKRRSPPLPAA